MKKLTKFGFLVLAFSLSAAFSQPGHVGINLAATGQLPIGDAEPGLGLGGLAGIEVGTAPGLALTGRSGYIYHFKKDDVVFFSQIPIMGGAKFTIPLSPIYLAGELGAVITHSEHSHAVGSNTTNDNTNFGWDAGLGSEVGPIDLRLTFNVLDAQNMSDAMTLGLSIGVDL